MRRFRAASAGATAGTLTFMVGGSDGGFAKARPILEKMGKNIVHTGPMGAGQAAKICNNMILGISHDRRGRRLSCWASAWACRRAEAVRHRVDVAGQLLGGEQLLPVPGPVPTSPANRDYQAGFTADN